MASDYSAETPADYLRSRVDFKTEAYRVKGDRYRWGYQVMACSAAIAAAIVPVLINLKVDAIWPTVLSLLVTVLVSLEGILHLREHWKNYDLMKSSLRQEACLFQAKTGPYRDQPDGEAFKLLVERVEEAISKERAQTIEMRTARSTPAEPPKPAPPAGPRAG